MTKLKILTIFIALVLLLASCGQGASPIDPADSEGDGSGESVVDAGISENTGGEGGDNTDNTGKEGEKEGETDAPKSDKTPLILNAVYAIREPKAGNYPQSLHQYPLTQNVLSESMFSQTLEWRPSVEKVFERDTQYAAILTLIPKYPVHTFIGSEIGTIRGIPEEGVTNITSRTEGDNLILEILFEKTDAEYAEQSFLFYDDFDGEKLDESKWDVCPGWDRHGRSTWDDKMVSVADGFLSLRFEKDSELGARKTSNKTLADDWIRAGAIRSRTTSGRILFENTHGYYESRIKFPKISGTWGAFWLMSPTQHIITEDGVIGTEIDIVESIANPRGGFNAALHWNGYGEHHRSTGSGDVSVVNIYDGEFHTFAFDWSPGEYIFYVDGVEFWRSDGGASFSSSGINLNPNYIKLSVEAANWAARLPGGFTEGEMLVDYVRVYAQPPNLR